MNNLTKISALVLSTMLAACGGGSSSGNGSAVPETVLPSITNLPKVEGPISPLQESGVLYDTEHRENGQLIEWSKISFNDDKTVLIHEGLDNDDGVQTPFEFTFSDFKDKDGVVVADSNTVSSEAVAVLELVDGQWNIVNAAPDMDDLRVKVKDENSEISAERGTVQTYHGHTIKIVDINSRNTERLLLGGKKAGLSYSEFGNIETNSQITGGTSATFAEADIFTYSEKPAQTPGEKTTFTGYAIGGVENGFDYLSIEGDATYVASDDNKDVLTADFGNWYKIEVTNATPTNGNDRPTTTFKLLSDENVADKWKINEDDFEADMRSTFAGAAATTPTEVVGQVRIESDDEDGIEAKFAFGAKKD